MRVSDIDIQVSQISANSLITDFAPRFLIIEVARQNIENQPGFSGSTDNIFNTAL